ncbi:MAG TPA: APC family permease [Candidatus Dormibacteraeota bacterium]|nr:APC family permease [Candidatus Dormibacteraeota bacterium]
MGPEAVARRGRRPGDLRVVVRRPAKLPRTLGAPALFAACYGNVGSSIYYALGVTAAFALGLTPLALILAGLIFVSTALNYAEGTAALPHAGGSSSFARRAFNGPIGFLVGWVQLLNYTATVSISSYFAISYLGVFGRYVPLFGMLKQNDAWHVGATVLLIAFLVVVNIIGIQESSVLNLVLAVADLVTQLVLVVLGVLLLVNIQRVISNVHLGIAPTWGNFLASVSIAMVTYTGIETISNMSEEAKNPGRSVPRATFAVIAAVLFVSAFLPTIGMSVFPVHLAAGGAYTTDLATTWKDNPVAGIVTGFAVVSQPLAFWSGIWVGVLAFTILVIATNAGLIGISRLSYSLAVVDLLPSRFAQLHSKFKTPYFSIFVFGIAAAVLVLPGILVGGHEIDLLGAVYSLAATFAFCSAHLSVMRLRFIEPALHRPYRMPGNIRFGRDSIPVISLVGALAIGTVFTQLMSQNISNSTFIYLGWLVLGGITFVLYRRHRHQPLWEPLEVPPPHERDVERVPFEPLPRSARYRLGRRERIAAHAATAPVRHEHHRPGWQLELELFFARHGAVRGVLIVLVFAATSGLAVFVDLSKFDPFGPGLGWSPGLVVVAFVAAYLLNRSHAEQ